MVQSTNTLQQKATAGTMRTEKEWLEENEEEIFLENSHGLTKIICFHFNSFHFLTHHPSEVSNLLLKETGFQRRTATVADLGVDPKTSDSTDRPIWQLISRVRTIYM
jgi:hypothetical protein